MSAYTEFEKVIFSFAVKAAETGGQEAVDRVEYGHIFHFEDRDAIKALRENAVKLSRSSLERLQGNLNETIMQGVRDGKPISEVTQDVRAVFRDFKGWEAERIARTEVARGVSEGALSGYREMGVETVEYYANTGACPQCEVHHGELMTADRASGFIPVHPNCYCFWLPRPDITNRNIEGWRSVGEMPEDVVTGLGVDLAFKRVSMNPKTLTKIETKSHRHIGYEQARLAVEVADRGFVDSRGDICLVSEIPDGWTIVPIKQTNTSGMEARTAYWHTWGELETKLTKAVKTYGF